MRCEDCGRDIPRGKEKKTTRSEEFGYVSQLGANTRTVEVTLCPKCARERDRTEVLLWIAIGLLIAGSIGSMVFLW